MQWKVVVSGKTNSLNLDSRGIRHVVSYSLLVDKGETSGIVRFLKSTVGRKGVQTNFIHS